jgi:hypothetical protein
MVASFDLRVARELTKKARWPSAIDCSAGAGEIISEARE